jgi:RNA polymerase sigma-70 factor (ECF subfamily)
MDENDILAKAQGGDLDAFGELVKLYQGNVRASLAVRLSNRHEADDLAQEAFIIAYRKLDTFDITKAFGPWIRSIAFNLLRNYWRKHKAIAVGDAAELDMMIDQQINRGYSSDNEAERLSMLKRCIAKLDQPMQELLRLRYFEEISVRDISRSLKLKHSTVTMRLYRLRESLFNCVEGQNGNS